MLFFASSWLCFPLPSVLLAIIVMIVCFWHGASSAGDLLQILRTNSLQSFSSWPALQQALIAAAAQVVVPLVVGFLVLIFGVIRPIFFPPRATYYRVDTALMFYLAVHKAVGDVIQGLRAEQGLRLLTEEELKPIMRGFGR